MNKTEIVKLLIKNDKDRKLPCRIMNFQRTNKHYEDIPLKKLFTEAKNRKLISKDKRIMLKIGTWIITKQTGKKGIIAGYREENNSYIIDFGAKISCVYPCNVIELKRQK